MIYTIPDLTKIIYVFFLIPLTKLIPFSYNNIEEKSENYSNPPLPMVTIIQFCNTQCILILFQLLIRLME